MNKELFKDSIQMKVLVCKEIKPQKSNDINVQSEKEAPEKYLEKLEKVSAVLSLRKIPLEIL